MQVVILKQPLYGTVYWNGLDFVYTSNSNVNVNDFFIYSQTVNGITTIYEKYINLNNTRPIANNIQLTAYVGQNVEIDISQLATDSTNPFDFLSITSVSGNNYGKLSTDGKKIYYKPEPYNEIENIVYTISDKQLESNGLITLNLIGGLSTREIKISGIRRFTALEKKIEQLSSLSGGLNSMYSILSTFETTWDNINYERYNPMADVVDIGNLTWTFTYNNKQKYENLITVLCANSADWNSDVIAGSNAYNLINSRINVWKSDYNILTTYDSDWNLAITTHDTISTELDAIDNKIYDTQQTVNDNGLTTWDSTEIASISSNYFDNWNELFTFLNSYSSIWNTNITNVNILSSSYYFNKLKLDIDTGTVNTSSNWDSSVISNNLNSNSADWNNIYNILQTYSASWNISNTFADQIIHFNNLYNFVKQTSSILWDSSETFPYNTISLSYNYIYNIINSNSGIWNTNYYSSVSADFFNKLNDYNNLYYSLCTLSGNWDSLKYYPFNALKDNWNSVYQNLNQDNYNKFTTSVTNYLNFYNVYVTNSSVFDNLTNYINANKTIFDNSILIDILTSNNIKWNDTYNNVKNLSTNWFFSNTISDSLINLYNTINSNSASYEDTKNTVNTNLTLFLTGNDNISFSANNLNLEEDLTIYNNLSVFNTLNKIDTEIQTTSSFIVYNDSTNDALIVTKNGNYGGLATFKNPLSVNVLDINANKTVGINTSEANNNLTIVGNISATGYIYPYLEETINSFASNSAKYFSNYTYVSANSANIDNLNIYNNYVLYLNLSTSTINTILTNDYIRYENMVNISNSQSAINEQVYNFISLSSDDFYKDFLYRDNKSIYDNLYLFVSSNTV